MWTRTLLLTLHIAAVAAWLGANLVQFFINPRFKGRPANERLAWADAGLALAERYYNAAGGLIAVSGIALVLTQDWAWSAGFIGIGFAVVIIGGGLGGMVFTPLYRKIRVALEAGDTAEADRLGQRFTRFALVDTALLIFAIVSMVKKIGV